MLQLTLTDEGGTVLDTWNTEEDFDIFVTLLEKVHGTTQDAVRNALVDVLVGEEDEE